MVLLKCGRRVASGYVVTDHIPVQADLSDLAEVITWCKTHDAECHQIVLNAERLYDRLINLEGQLDYMQLMTYQMAKQYVPEGEGGRCCTLLACSVRGSDQCRVRVSVLWLGGVVAVFSDHWSAFTRSGPVWLAVKEATELHPLGLGL